jgi:hypothetical protein
MDLLTHMLGPFPVGIWAVLGFLLVSGVGGLIFAQGLSFLNWDAALSLRLQEDSKTSEDPVERTIGAMSQGEAGADVIVQGPVIVIAIAGIFLRHPVGWLAGLVLGVMWVYVTVLLTFQRWMLFRWGVVGDLARLRYIAPLMVLFWGLPGVVMVVCLAVNRGFFGL